jgi:hypothetical protein
MFLFSLLISSTHQPAPQVFEIDFSQTKPISKYIYGVNSPGWAGSDFPFTLGRLGGNRMTAFNWETNASNAGSDYQNQNDGFMGESNVPGDTLKKFLEFDEAHGAATLMTIPTAGYVSADKNGDGDVNKTPDYLEKRFYRSLPRKNAKFVYPPDVSDRFVYQDECVAWLESIKSPSEPLWYMLDNEPDLWGSTHSRIWPKNPTYAQIIQNNVAYAAAIKAVAPHTLIFGPANYGWQGFHNFQGASDANGRDFLDTYLDALREAGDSAGKRLLDVLDVHWYPEAQGGGVRVTEGEKPETEAARIQAPRSLWDPTYVEDSWIARSIGNKPLVLLPTIFKQIQDHYPGTKFSISEYNYGGNKSISGAIAQADVLGLFGRYGLFAACNWGIDKADIGEIAGFKAFINFDGMGGMFGDREGMVSDADPKMFSVYASQDSKNPNHVVIVAINKTSTPQEVSFRIAGFKVKSVRTYAVGSNSLTAPSPGRRDVSGNSSAFSYMEDPLSVTTLDVTGA